jgi:anti-sigma-K factor RskA
VNAHEQFRELAESYALGVLDAAERVAFEAHLAACAECAKAVDEARLAVSELAYLAPPVAPSSQVKERLLQQVRSDAATKSQPIPVRSAAPWWLWAGAAALLLFSVYSAWEAQRLQDQVRGLHEQAALERHRRETLEREYLAAQMQARILMDPRSKKIMLSAKDPHVPQLEAMWNPELGLCLMGHDVPMPSPNRAFQLWLIPKSSGSKPMPVHSMMWPDAGGKLMHVVEKPPEAMWDTKAIAITEEPMAGSEQPTSEPMWSGSLS